MAEVLLRHHLAEAGIKATVHSAGLYPGGSPATDHGVATMAKRGLDLEGHRSRKVERSMVDGADLVIGMAREHVREAAVLGQGALAKVFTLKELARLADDIGPRPVDEPLASWLARAAAGRRRDDLMGVGHDDAFDVADPIGRGLTAYQTTADLIDGLLERVVALAWPTNDQQERSA
jgi:protein-tyrosine phosphatase